MELAHNDSALPYYKLHWIADPQNLKFVQQKFVQNTEIKEAKIISKLVGQMKNVANITILK